MKKSDLRNGMIVKTANGEVGIVLKGVKTRYGISDIVKFKYGFERLFNFDENLNCDDCSIVEIYDIDFWGADINELFCINDKMKRALLWKKEIDWTKVPKWTKVQVRDFDLEEWKNGYFLKCEDEEYTGSYPFIATSCDEFTISTADRKKERFAHCRLHESVEPKEEWYV